MEPELVERVRALCDRAGLKGRPREVVELRLQGREEVEIAAELGIAVATVYVHSHTARKKLSGVEPEWTEREFYRFLLAECLRGPRVSSPGTPLYRVLPGGGGERVRVSGGPLVAVDDLLGRRF
jgi:hypothetical protein